ncbi:MAG TPA: mercury methylation corrinoid protein HgcA, partial [Thermoleophilia bacterium]
TAAGPVPHVSGELGRADRLGAWRVRWGIRRGDYRVRPGLYALGRPDATSPVLVTANYKLTFDALRASVGEVGAWLLVVDTRGINVWCAAGKGTFSAGEVARMVHASRLAEVVTHRRLILPQLSAPGVAAHRVREACGFRVTFGPVRAADVPAFLAAGRKADAAMRTVTFDLRERLVLAPAELKVLWDRRMLLAYAGAIAVSSVDGQGVSLRRGLRRGLPLIGATGLAVLAGGGVTPALLPWLPGRSFSLKGAAAGAAVAAGAVALSGERLSPAAKVALLAGVPAVSSYAAMNFTGSSSITSPSGVEFEMRRAMPVQAAGAVLAAGAWLASRLGR